MRHFIRRALLVGAAVLAVTSCSSGGSNSSTTDSSTTGTDAEKVEFVPTSFTWSECDNAEPDSLVTCATLDVPYDYDDASVGMFSLFVKKRSVDPEKVKSIVVTVATNEGKIVDNREIPDICLQHMMAVMLMALVFGGSPATLAPAGSASNCFCVAVSLL